MNPVLMDVLPFVRQGFCCSQLLMLLMLQARGEENPALVRSLQGLCHGIGHSEGDCGLLPGGACVLALLCGKGADEEVPHQMLNPCLTNTPHGSTSVLRNTAAIPVLRWRPGLARGRERTASPILWPAESFWLTAG